MKANRSKLAVMGILSIRPMSGYEIRKTINQSVGFFWNESFGQIYPILKKLVAEGLAIQEQAPAKGKVKRNKYSLTDQGRRELQEWLAAPANPDLVRSEFVLKLFFGAQVNIEDNIRHIEREKFRAVETLSILNAIAKALKQQDNRAEQPSYPMITLQYGMYSIEATIKWCEATLQTLREYADQEAVAD